MSSNLINVIACDQYYFYISNVWEINIWIDSVFFFLLLLIFTRIILNMNIIVTIIFSLVDTLILFYTNST